jgi:glycolate oxidase iron-sulfur subunit
VNNYSPGQYPDDFGFATFSENTVDTSGPCIPEARDCLGCGVCMGRCPTYRIKPVENYGPRGRVRLIERVLRKSEILSKDEVEALDACTLCGACANICPSKMDYVGLYHQVLEGVGIETGQRATIKLLLDWVADRSTVQRVLAVLLRLYQWSRIPRIWKALPAWLLENDFGRLINLLPVPYVSRPVPGFSLAAGTETRGEVSLFTGCVANILDTQTHEATIRLLTHSGYAVRVDEGQTCCGAIYARNGEVERARTCARRNIATFSGNGSGPILYNASGCGAFLSEYHALLSEDAVGDNPDTLRQAQDVMDFLTRAGRMDDLEFRERRARVAVHEPCSQRNLLKNHETVYALLSRIPGLELIPLPGNEMCCGAGGTKMLSRPELAVPLRDEKVQALVDSGAELLISSNLTCALHLASGIRKVGQDIQVMHPVRLLAQQLV